MKENKRSIFWGVLLVIAGVLYLGNVTEIWNVNVFFKGWWTIFIIGPSIFGLFKKEFISSIFGIAIGVLLLLASRNIIEWDMVGKTFFPLVLIVIGLSILTKPKTNKSNIKNSKEYIGIFGSNESKVVDKFNGTSIVSVFGGVDLDLSKSKITEDIVIECVSVFGGIDIRLPENVKVKTSGVPIFGGIEDKSEHGDGPTVNINYVCVFGGVDLK